MAVGLLIGFIIFALVAIFGFKVFKKDVTPSYPKLVIAFVIIMGIMVTWAAAIP